MYIYKFLNDTELIGVAIRGSGYTLEKGIDNGLGIVNEYSSETKLAKPVVSGEDVIESETAQETLNREASEVSSELLEKIILDAEKGHKQFLKFKQYLKQNITPSQEKSSRTSFGKVFDALKNGDWDIALDEVQTVTPSVGEIGDAAIYMEGVISAYLT